MVRVSNCGHDENNRYSGGTAGDQSGTEWYLRSWYAYPWNYILRWKNEELGRLLADLALEAARNENIGYDQGERTTFAAALKEAGWRPANIRKPCEADCSRGTIDLIRAVGYLKGIPELQTCDKVMSYTGDMMNWFNSSTGQKYFTILTGKYLVDPNLARKGDINLNVVHHVNITVDNGAASGSVQETGNTNFLQNGDCGEAVSTMQKMLIALGYSCGISGADGEFGNDTESALRQFQTKNGLEVDGQYGPESKAKLEKLYNEHTTARKSQNEVLFKGKARKNMVDVRTWAGNEYENIKSCPYLSKGQKVDVMNYTQKANDGSLWYYIRIKLSENVKVFGFAAEKFIEKV